MFALIGHEGQSTAIIAHVQFGSLLMLIQSTRLASSIFETPKLSLQRGELWMMNIKPR